MENEDYGQGEEGQYDEEGDQGEEEGEEIEEGEDIEEGNANPPKIKVKTKRQNFNEVSGIKNEMSSNAKLAYEAQHYNIDPNKLNYIGNNNTYMRNKKKQNYKNMNSELSKINRESDNRRRNNNQCLQYYYYLLV